MKQVTESQFCEVICKDYNIEQQYKYTREFNSFPLVNNKRKINFYNNGIIVDRKGNEFPYMLSNYVRNEERLLDFNYIYCIKYKSLINILQELNLVLKSESCKICEGGGWYTTGIKYFYKDIYCEL